MYENQKYQEHRFDANFVEHAVAFHSDGKIEIGTNTRYCHTEIYIVRENRKSSNKTIPPHRWAINVFHKSFVKQLKGFKVKKQGWESLARSENTNETHIDYFSGGYAIDHNSIMSNDSYKGTIQNPVVLRISVTQKSPIDQKLP